MKNSIFNFSIRCNYQNGNYTEHRQNLKLADLPKWVEAYRFTHPNVISITIKLWFSDLNKT